MDEIIKHEIIMNCYYVNRGKPAASVALQERHVEQAIIITKDDNLHSYVEILAEGWVTFWIYKYPHILEVINAAPQAPKTTLDHWLLGKLFGYDEASIDEFVSKRV